MRRVAPRWATLLGALFCALSLSPAHATAYVFPGALPASCSGSGPAYTCSSTVTLASADTVTINSPKPATITITGGLTVNAAKINNAGTAADLTLSISGLLSSSAGAVINAHVTAGSVSNSGAVTYGGSLTSNGAGAITIGAGSTVAGAVSSTTGAVNLLTGTSTNYTTVGSINTGGTVTLNSYNSVLGDTTGYLISSAGHNSYGGGITSTNTYVSLGGYATVTGAIVSQTYVDTGLYSSIGGSITANTSYVALSGHTTVGGSIISNSYVDTGSTSSVTGSITTTGASGTYIDIHDNTSVGGAMTSKTYISMITGSTVGGDMQAGSTIFMGAGSSAPSSCVRSTSSGTITLPSPPTVAGACCGIAPTCTNTCVSATPKPPACASGPHHLVIQHGSGSGLTCSPSTVTIVACANAACSAYYTGGVTGTLTSTGAGMTTNFVTGATFTIAAGSSSTTEDLQVTTAGSVVLGTSGLTPAATTSTSCNFGSPSCTFTAADAGLLLNVPNHVSNVSQSVSVSAVKKADNSLACTPAFANVSKTVNFTCAYTNPNTGTLPVIVGGMALNAGNGSAAACDGTGQAVSLNFDANGVASTTALYADVGQMSLSASYSGSGTSAGLSMTGSDSFIAAPASFAFSGITAAPIKAGALFAATVTARNNTGATVLNFGRETSPESVRLTWSRYSPTGTAAVSGSLSGTGVAPAAALGGFSGGAATASDLSWTEVGTGDLNATLSSGSYLGSGLTATGSTGTTGAVGRFIPDHFDTVISPQPCGTFTYSGQPFTVQILARNVGGSTTLNYDGTSNTSPKYAKVVTLSAANNACVSCLSNSVVGQASFSAGSATVATPSFTFASKLTSPTSVSIRATDTDGVSSSSHAEGSVALRSGRMKLFNTFGKQGSALQVPVQTQYWSGKVWVLNGSDSCTFLPAASVALSNYLDHQGAVTTTWTTSPSAVTVTGGQGTLVLSAPSPSLTGSVDVAFNLGSGLSDQSCLADHPASLGASLSWLRDRNGSANACAGVSTYDRDPSARATFGIYSPESKKLIFIQDIF